MGRFRLHGRIVSVLSISALCCLPWVGCPQQAAAQSISPDFLGVTNNGNGTFTYSYNILLDNNTALSPGHEFVFFDFAGLQGTPTFTDNVAIAGTYAVSTQAFGPIPSGSVLLGSDTATPNIVLTYGGGSPSNNTGISQNLGRLDAISTSSLAPQAFNAFAANSSNADNGSPAGNQGFTRGPNPSIGDVPEPGAYALLAGMVVPAVLLYRRRRA